MPDRAQLIATILVRVADVGRQLAAARTGPFGGLPLSKSQLEALFLLAHRPGPVTAGALAADLSVTAGAVTQLVGGLRDQGLVHTVPHPNDGRVRVIRLTPSAFAQVDAYERDAVHRLTPRFTDLTVAELELLANLLGRAV